MNNTDERAEKILREYSDLTQTLLPRVNDTIKIDLPTGERWIAIHLPSDDAVREKERQRMSRIWHEIRMMLGFLFAVFGLMLVVFILLPHHGHVPPGQHTRDMRAFSWGVFLLVLSAWTVWSKPLRSPDASEE